MMNFFWLLFLRAWGLVFLISCASQPLSVDQNSIVGTRGVEQVQSGLLVDNKGGIDKILMLSGGNSRFSEYFVKHKDKFGPCVIYPITNRIAFFSQEYYSDSLLGYAISIKPEPGWANYDGFSADTPNQIRDRDGNPVDLENLAVWLEVNMPFGKKFNLIVEGGDTIDLNELDPLDRVILASSYEGYLEDTTNESGEIEWKVTKSGYTDIRVISNLRRNEVAPFYAEKVSKVDSSLSINEKVKLLRAQVVFNAELRRVIAMEVERIGVAAGISVSSLFLNTISCFCDYSINRNCSVPCVFDIRGELSSYFQDIFHVRNFADNQFQLNTADANRCVNAEYTASLIQLLTCKGSKSEKDAICGIAGGNMYVTENVAFIGRDELEKLKVTQTSWLNDGNGNPITDEKAITNKLLSLLYANPKGKKLVWVGPLNTIYKHSVTKAEAGDSVKQPVYHIDLFFHPLGQMSVNNPNEYYYLIADPINVSGYRDDRTAIAYLDSVITETAKLIDSELKAMSLIPKPIELPLGVKYKGERSGNKPKSFHVAEFFSSLNGLVELENDTMTYYYPKYSSGNDTYRTRLVDQFRIMSDSIKKAMGVNPHLIPVTSTYGENSALRCSVKVLSRN